uniref:Uncharacterized protein n=1 Tax=Arundo donax TaxID=35708 RepID=A0A0A9BBP0_ARUDO
MVAGISCTPMKRPPSATLGQLEFNGFEWPCYGLCRITVRPFCQTSETDFAHRTLWLLDTIT